MGQHTFTDRSAAKGRTARLGLAVTPAHSNAFDPCGTTRRETRPLAICWRKSEHGILPCRVGIPLGEKLALGRAVTQGQSNAFDQCGTTRRETRPLGICWRKLEHGILLCRVGIPLGEKLALGRAVTQGQSNAFDQCGTTGCEFFRLAALVSGAVGSLTARC